MPAITRNAIDKRAGTENAYFTHGIEQEEAETAE
jgi:hypothetical protein